MTKPSLGLILTWYSSAACIKPVMAEPYSCWCRPSMLRFFDVLFSCLIIFPAVIIYWSGTWKFLDLHIFPHHHYTAMALFLLIGLFMLITGYFALPVLEEFVVLEDLRRDFTKHLVVSKIFSYCIALGYVFLWKGVWMLTELSFGVGLRASVIIAVVSLTLLLLMRSVSNATTIPFAINLDNTQDFYKTEPKFRVQLTPDAILPYSLDVLFTCLIIEPLSIAYWVGLWNLCDAALLPEQREISFIVSGCVGLGGTFLVFALQKPAMYIGQKLQTHPILNMVYSCLHHIVVVFLGFMLWRGCWGYLDNYVLREDQVWLMAVFHVVGMTFLMVLQVSRSCASLSCGIDGEVGGSGTCVELDVSFLTYYCRHRQIQQSLQIESLEESQSLLYNEQSSLVYGGF